MVTEGERLRDAKLTPSMIEDATSLAFMSKREIYEKLINNKINNKSEGDMI